MSQEMLGELSLPIFVGFDVTGLRIQSALQSPKDYTDFEPTHLNVFLVSIYPMHFYTTRIKNWFRFFFNIFLLTMKKDYID